MVFHWGGSNEVESLGSGADGEVMVIAGGDGDNLCYDFYCDSCILICDDHDCDRGFDFCCGFGSKVYSGHSYLLREVIKKYFFRSLTVNLTGTNAPYLSCRISQLLGIFLVCCMYM